MDIDPSPQAHPTGQFTVRNDAGNTSARGNEISAHLDEENITTGPRIRKQKQAYATTLLQTDELSWYRIASSAAYSIAMNAV